jgi:hypothetical protein
MPKENKYDRRRFLGIGTMAIAAANLGMSVLILLSLPT